MTSEQGGAIANRQGNILEQQVRQAFASHGFREVAFAEYEKLASGSTLPGVPVPDLLVRRVPYQSIYGHRGVTEFRPPAGSPSALSANGSSHRAAWTKNSPICI